MKTAKDYPITQPYGYDPNYQGNTRHWHTGIDYGAPEGTPIVVNNVQIGLVGHTGKVYDQKGQNTINAAHLHLGKYAPSETNPGNGGFDLSKPVRVTTVGYDSSNGNYVRLTDATGVSWVYCHMSKQLVTQGTTLEEEEVKWTNGDTYNLLFHAVGMDVAEKAKKANFEGYFGLQNGMEASKAFNDIISSPQFDFLVAEARKNGSNDSYTQIGTINGDAIYKKG